MRRREVEVTLRGASVTPEQVPLRELVEVLQSIERLVTSYAKAKLVELPEGPVVSLVGVRAGSEHLAFSTPEPVVPVWAGLSKAVQKAEYSELPRETYDVLYGFSQSLEKKGWELEIVEDEELEIEGARIGVGSDLLAPREAVYVEGTTTIHGECLRVGGATQPRAEVRLSSTGKLVNVDLSKETARKLASRLYEEVALEGKARWRVDTWEIERFRVSSVTPYRPSDPADAFAELAKTAEGRWDDVDAEEYVHSLRD